MGGRTKGRGKERERGDREGRKERGNGKRGKRLRVSEGRKVRGVVGRKDGRQKEGGRKDREG